MALRHWQSRGCRGTTLRRKAGRNYTLCIIMSIIMIIITTMILIRLGGLCQELPAPGAGEIMAHLLSDAKRI